MHQNPSLYRFPLLPFLIFTAFLAIGSIVALAPVAHADVLQGEASAYQTLNGTASNLVYYMRQGIGTNLSGSF